MGRKHTCDPFSTFSTRSRLTGPAIHPICAGTSNIQPSVSLISLQTAACEWWAGGPRGPPRWSATADVSDLSSANQIGVFRLDAGFRLQTGDAGKKKSGGLNPQK